MINELSIVFPVYNEQKRLKKAFIEILKFNKNFKSRKLEIIFSDDMCRHKVLKLHTNGRVPRQPEYARSREYVIQNSFILHLQK